MLHTIAVIATSGLILVLHSLKFASVILPPLFDIQKYNSLIYP